MEGLGAMSEKQIALFEKKVQSRWLQSDEQEANRLVNDMIRTPSKLWFDMVFKAENREIKHWELLLKYKDQLTSIAAEAVANEDDQVVVK